MYELSCDIKSFAVANDFAQITSRACYQLGKSLTPFTVCGGEDTKKYGVADVSDFGGMIDEDKSLMSEVAELRIKEYAGYGMHLDLSMEKALFYDYLMSMSICYVEVPKYVTKNGYAQPTYDKFLCTRNPAIMAAWMGCTASEMQAKYSSRIQSRLVEFKDGLLRCVKLVYGAKGNTVTLPRDAYSVEKMVCIPMYMLYAFIEGMKPELQSGILKFSYLKDNGTVRELCSTLSESILMSYYEDNSFVSQMLGAVDINTVQQGGMVISSKMNRGYIKIPEVGASVYDGTGVRSLNLARLLKVERVSEVDRSFIHVDLESVVDAFCDGVDSVADVEEVYRTLACKEPASTGVACAEELKQYARDNAMFLSTTFKRSLHKFMAGHPEWFPTYTGRPYGSVVSSSVVNTGAMPIDF